MIILERNTSVVFFCSLAIIANENLFYMTEKKIILI